MSQKRVCDFLLVRHSNLGLILHRFRDIAGFVLMTQPLLHPNLGVLPLDQIADVGISPRRNLKLISHEIIFEVFEHVRKNMPERHIHTDGQTDGRLTVA